MNSFLLAVQFLTIIPVTQPFIASGKQLGASTLFYPFTGFIIGSILTLVTLLLTNLSLNIQSTIILILWVLLTGGLHLDGLADCADAWVGGLGSKQRSMDIMKDPAAGPIAVIVLVLLLLLKWSIISTILEKQALHVLLLTPMLGRTALLIMMLTTQYIRTGGLGEKLVAHLPVYSAIIISLFGLFISLYYLGVLSVIFMLITIVAISYQAKKRIGGVTGDVYGATVELTELGVLLAVVI